MSAARKLALSLLAALLAACPDPAADPPRDVSATVGPRDLPRAGLLGPSAEPSPTDPRCGDLGPQRRALPLGPDAPRRPHLAVPAVALALPLRSADLDTLVLGTTAETSVVHTFHNPLSMPVDAEYVLPLVPGAAVVAFAVRRGDRLLYSTVRRHLADGPAPADRFSLPVDAIPPGADVAIELRVVAPLQPTGGRYTLVLPTAVDAPPVADDPRLRGCGNLDVHLRLASGIPLHGLRSRHHGLLVDPTPGEVRLALTRELRPDRDLELSWELAGDAPQAHLLTQRTADGGGHLALEIHPPRSFPAALARPRELIVAFDAAPALPARPRALVRAAVHALLTDLGPADTVQLLRLVDDHALALAPAPLPADRVDRALALLDAPDADIDTTRLAAVTAALTRPADPERQRVLIFIGDGALDDPMRTALARARADARLCILAIDAPDRPGLAALARAGRCIAVFADAHDPPGAVAARLRERVGRPVLTDIRVDWGDLPVQDPAPAELPDLHLGAPLVVRGRLRPVPRGRAAVRIAGTLGSRPFELVVHADDRSGDHGPLGPAWGGQRIDELFADPATAREPVTSIGLEQHLTTPFTALFMVEDRRARLPGGDVRVLQFVADAPASAPQPWPLRRGGAP